MEWIDMAFANAGWRELYPQATVFVEAAVGSDHNPLTLNTSLPLNKVGKPFRFESFWVTEEDCRSIVSLAWSKDWEGSMMLAMCKKLRGCKELLKEWDRTKFRDLRLRIAVTKEQLLDVQKQLGNGDNPDFRALEEKLIRKLA